MNYFKLDQDVEKLKALRGSFINNITPTNVKQDAIEVIPIIRFGNEILLKRNKVSNEMEFDSEPIIGAGDSFQFSTLKTMSEKLKSILGKQTPYILEDSFPYVAALFKDEDGKVYIVIQVLLNSKDKFSEASKLNNHIVHNIKDAELKSASVWVNIVLTQLNL